MASRLGITRRQLSYATILVRELVVTDFRVKYQASFLGYLWSLLRPLFMFGILYLFFGVFLNSGRGVAHFEPYLLAGLILWNYFSEITGGSVAAVVNHSALLRKLYFPKYVMIVAVVVVATINLFLNAIVLVIFMVVFGADIGWHSFVVIPLVLELALFATGIGFVLSALYVRFRDIGYVWDIVLQAGFYATPIFYSLVFVREKSVDMAAVMSLNPVAQVVQDVRYALITTDSTTLENLTRTGWYRLVPVLFVLVFTAWSIWFFKRRAPSFAEEV